jgi:chemotaxis protein methyltransferase CheR
MLHPSDENYHALELLASLIHEKTGLFFEPNRYDLLVDRIMPLAVERDCQTLMEYYYILKYDEHPQDEWLRLQSALAVNETYFWREYDQIKAIAEVIIPQIQRSQPNRPVRIWHAACASGEEPYTLAIALSESGGDLSKSVEIFASDFNRAALAQAQEGVYRKRSFRVIPPAILERYFKLKEKDRYQIIPSIRQRVQFTYHNLMDDVSAFGKSGYDIIMCRNVFIYFSDSAIRQVAESFYHALTPSGYLFVASAESLLRLTNRFDLVEIGGAFGYLKRPLSEDYQSKIRNQGS